MIDSERTRLLRACLVEDLVARGEIHSPAWRQAFAEVPRHLFVPRFYRYTGEGRLVFDSADPERYDDWLHEVYRDVVLNVLWDEQHPLVNSTSSMPSKMAQMLEALDLDAGHRVLEIGTGTGYNAALLCERLGSDRVTTVDIDAGLVEAARERLAMAGHSPTVVTADGFHGHPGNAPYDRVIATCQTRDVPAAWIDQCRPGGLVLAMLPCAMARLRVAAAGSAEGHFHPASFGFMSMREHWPSPPPAAELIGLLSKPGASRRAGFELWEAEGPFSPFWLFERLALLRCDEVVDIAQGVWGIVDLSDLSWVRFDRNRSRITQGGPRRIGDAQEELYALWCRLGRPDRERFGVTVTPERTQFAWLDHPASEHRWALPTWP